MLAIYIFFCYKSIDKPVKTDGGRSSTEAGKALKKPKKLKIELKWNQRL